MKEIKRKVVLMILILIAIASVDASVNHIVGGGYRGWSLNSNLFFWSTSTSFIVNDSLVFSYTPDHDVIEVSKSDYTICRINSPIATYEYDDQNGQTVIPLTQPGWRYFVCGRPNHCSMGLKVSVQVVDQLNNTSVNQTSPQTESHPSLGYSNFNEVASVKYVVQLSIFIMCFLALPAGW